MLRKYKITYNTNKEVVIEATSKYNAKKRFYVMYPRYTINSIDEVTE